MTTTTAPIAPTVVESPAQRARWAIHDVLVMTRRNLLRVVKEPSDAILTLSIPIMMVLTFGYVFGSAMDVAGGAAGYRAYFMPGVFVMTLVYSIASTATGVAIDIDKGVVDRFRSMPLARSALLAGRSLADVVRTVATIAVLVGCGLLVGWRWHEGWARVLGAVGLLLLMSFALIWVGIYLGLVVPNPDTASLAVYPLAFPLTVLSSAFVPPTAMPGVLGTISEWNPLTATIDATRELFGSPGLTGDSWIAQNAVLMAVVWPLLILAVVVPLAVRRYQRLSR
ncbi:MAG TPA: ABC transporter permease [Jiangellaceae bacterium]|nr:ABC transporter permease [Jiangellaceae bacterium]